MREEKGAGSAAEEGVKEEVMAAGRWKGTLAERRSWMKAAREAEEARDAEGGK